MIPNPTWPYWHGDTQLGAMKGSLFPLQYRGNCRPDYLLNLRGTVPAPFWNFTGGADANP